MSFLEDASLTIINFDLLFPGIAVESCEPFQPRRPHCEDVFLQAAPAVLTVSPEHASLAKQTELQMIDRVGEK